ncbi:hypothetical protein pb186bvf_000142 [Paramecium bursaria]
MILHILYYLIITTDIKDILRSVDKNLLLQIFYAITKFNQPTHKKKAAQKREAQIKKGAYQEYEDDQNEDKPMQKQMKDARKEFQKQNKEKKIKKEKEKHQSEKRERKNKGKGERIKEAIVIILIIEKKMTL